MQSVLLSIAAIWSIFILISILLIFIQKKFKSEESPIVNAINSLLPQTQCGQCSYPGCMPYATAISKDEAEINRCPPGGEQTIVSLANLLNKPVLPLADDLEPASAIPMLAKINEHECIGCLLCIKACPVDAIVGANKQMHTVISADCTGCELCIAPCPMDCIEMYTPLQQIQNIIHADPEGKNTNAK